MGLHKVIPLLSALLVTNDCKESCLISDPFLFFAAHHWTSSNCCHSASFFSELPGELFDILDDKDWFTEWSRRARRQNIENHKKLKAETSLLFRAGCPALPSVGTRWVGNSSRGGRCRYQLIFKVILTN